MGEGDRARLAGGTRRVDLGGDLVAAAARQTLEDGREVERRLGRQVRGEAGHVRERADLDAGIRQQVSMLVVGETAGDLGLIDDRGDLGGRGRVVDRDRDGADRLEGEVEEVPVQARAAEDRHPVTLGNAPADRLGAERQEEVAETARRQGAPAAERRRVELDDRFRGAGARPLEDKAGHRRSIGDIDDRVDRHAICRYMNAHDATCTFPSLRCCVCLHLRGQPTHACGGSPVHDADTLGYRPVGYDTVGYSTASTAANLFPAFSARGRPPGARAPHPARMNVIKKVTFTGLGA